MDYDSYTLLELKTMCKDRGLRVSGKKAEVVIRLIENDEENSPTPPPQSVTIQTQSQQPVTHIYVQNSSDTGVIVTGVFIVLYGLFRIFVGGIFSSFGEAPVQSFIAMTIGLGYIAGGVITIQGYKQGLQLTLGILVISGILSIIYHDEWSPLSMGMEGIWPIEFSLICSGFCMLVVAAPLIAGMGSDGRFKQGSPKFLEAAARFATGVAYNNVVTYDDMRPSKMAKMVINCVHCNSKLKVPVGYQGNVKCPSCGNKFEVS